MLGAWARIHLNSKTLEVGCGTGIISLMIAQSNVSSEILALDINPNAVILATSNFSNSKWNNQLSCLHEDFRKPTEQITRQKYHHIICNPPFFKNGLLSQSKVQEYARHGTRIGLDEFIAQSAGVLYPGGTIQLILPYDRIQELENIVAENQLYLSRVTLVKSLSNKDVYRALVEISNQKSTVQSSNLTMYSSEGNYSQDYKNLLADYMQIF